MDKLKALGLTEKLLFLYLLIFPFGQLLALKAHVFGANIRIHPADLIIFPFTAIFFLKGLLQPKFFEYLKSILLLGVFSLIFSLFIFDPLRVVAGVFYFLRIGSYLGFFLAIYNLVRLKPIYKKILFLSLIVISLEVAFLGLAQYFLLPDLRFLYSFGWDDHLYRLVGTFLDPGFTGIILSLGSLLAFCLFLKEKKALFFWIMVFLSLCLLLTYSRASFLAFLVGLAMIFTKWKKVLAIAVGVVFLSSTVVLPRPEGYGVRLERTHSIIQRIQNYKETLFIFRQSPVFGIGFNNMCLARQKFLGQKNPDSHACSGSDSSFLLILATGGVIGLILTLFLLKGLIKMLDNYLYSLGFLSSLAALIVHSQFVNSLIYPWVMGFMAILGATALAKPVTVKR